MNTFDMLVRASIDGKTYIHNDLRYNMDKGFCDMDGMPWKASTFKTLDEFIELEGWKLVKVKKLTIAEIEANLGYPIEVIS